MKWNAPHVWKDGDCYCCWGSFAVAKLNEGMMPNVGVHSGTGGTACLLAVVMLPEPVLQKMLHGWNGPSVQSIHPSHSVIRMS